jgi:uncharacterized protein DUF6754
MNGLSIILAATAVTVPPPTDLRVSIPPNDDGTHLQVSFRASADRQVTAYHVFRTRYAVTPTITPDNRSGDTWEPVKILDALPGDARVTLLDTVGDPSARWWYAVRAVAPAGASAFAYAGPARPVAAWFNTERSFMAFAVALLGGLIVFYTVRARRGRAGYVRRIAGIDAMEEAIGRSTEMGRPVLYIPGIEEVQDIQTIAGLLILGHVAEVTARYETEIRVACAIPLAMVLSEEIVRQGFYNAGRPEAHRPQNIQFISSEQFAFTAGTVGIMMREKPATNIFLGRFYGESLVLAETGFVNKAIQIAGTAELTQLPFFIAACDYAIIGEELFAVSAYLSKDPRQLAMLKATDAFKMLVLILIVVGAILGTAGIADLGAWVAP